MFAPTPRCAIRKIAAFVLVLALVGTIAPSPAGAGQTAGAAVAQDSIGRLYEAYFLRPADRAGLDYWTSQAARGVPVAHISSHFASSAEFTARYGSLDDGGFVDRVYRNVLSRPAERAGADYWLGRLRTGLSRGALMVAFADSPEFRAVVTRRREAALRIPSAPQPTTTARPTTSAPATPTAGSSSDPSASSSSTASPSPSTATTSARTSTGFVHPGVVVGGEDLAFVRAKAAAGAQPWKGALDAVYRSGGSTKTARRPQTHRYSSLTYPPAPSSVIQAAGGGGTAYMAAHPELGLENIGGTEHLDDARAAYTHALLWSYTGDRAHAAKAIEIMNAWSTTLREIKFDQPRRADNGGQLFDQGKLQAGWGGSLFSRAAEIIRHSDAGWASADVRRFEGLLRDVYLPLVITGWSSGANWLMTFAEATMGIGVFTEDRSTFDAGVAMWRSKAPTTIYLPSDGPRPLPPNDGYDTDQELRSLWYGVSSYVSGLQAETARDLSHTTMGLGAMANGAATAALQGIDLFGEQRARIVAGYERTAGYLNDYLDEVARRGGAEPDPAWRPEDWVGGAFKLGGTAWRAGWEVANAHYAERGVRMPETSRLVERLRPTPSAALHLSWETLTHAR